MGFTTLIDIIGSTIIGGLLLLILIRMNITSMQNNYDYGGERIVQQNLVDVVQLLEYDFRKIGYCRDATKIKAAYAIIQADTSSITFQTDLPIITSPVSDLQYGDGIIDTVKYYLSSTSTLSSTPNPNDRILYRVVNHAAAAGSNLGVTKFRITYYDALGDQLGTTSNPLPSSAPFGISSMRIDISVENPVAVTDPSSGNAYTYDKRAMWRQVRIASRNFTKR